MKIYRADYANEDVFEIICADSDQEALDKAMEYENEYGILFNLTLLDDDYNELKTVF
jgi:hypothetical protein